MVKKKYKYKHKPRILVELAKTLKKPRYIFPKLSQEEKYKAIREMYGRLLYLGTEVPESERYNESINDVDLLQMLQNMEIAENNRIFRKTEW